MIQNLITHIKAFHPIAQDRLSLLESYFEQRTYQKKQVLLKEGDRCNEKFFIVKGCVYISYTRQNGTEQVIDFGIENWWASDFMAFPNHSLAQFSIHAVETTTVLCITTERQRELLDKVPELSEYFHLVFQRAYAASQKRVRLLYELSKEDLYRNFNRDYPAFVQRVPQYLLASFLGFTPEYLSEIRRKYIS